MKEDVDEDGIPDPAAAWAGRSAQRLRRHGRRGIRRGPRGSARRRSARRGRCLGRGIRPRTLVPLDVDGHPATRCARPAALVVADPAHRTCSAASEISAIVAEHAFASLRAPIVRVTTPDTANTVQSGSGKAARTPNREHDRSGGAQDA